MLDVRHPIEDREALSEFWEKFDLLAYTALIAIVTPSVALLLGEAWEAEGLSYTLIVGLQEALGVSHLEFVLFCLGAYAGAVTLLLFDDMKRIQGVLLVIASGIAIVVFRSRELLYPLYPLENIHLLGAGFATAFVLGGGIKLRTTNGPYEFRRVTTALFVLFSSAITIGFFEHHLDYENPLEITSDGLTHTGLVATQATLEGDGLFIHAVSASLFILGAYMFTRYEAKRNVFVIGVQRAGKTLLSSGLFIAADEDDERTKPNPSGPLSQLVYSLRTATEGWGNDEYVGPNVKGEYHLLRFRTKAGAIFKEYVDIELLDYAGEYLDKALVELVADMVPRSRASLNWLIYRYEAVRGLPDLPETAAGLDSEQVQRVMAKQIIHSDTLVVIVDSGSLVSHVPYGEDDYESQQDLSEYLDTYVQILRHLDQSILAEKDIVLVATKADYLHQLYARSNSRLSFFNWVNFHLLETDEGREKLGPLVDQGRIRRVYPVYYELDHETSREEGEPVPTHPLEIRGNDELLRRLKEGE